MNVKLSQLGAVGVLVFTWAIFLVGVIWQKNRTQAPAPEEPKPHYLRITTAPEPFDVLPPPGMKCQHIIDGTVRIPWGKTTFNETLLPANVFRILTTDKHAALWYGEFYQCEALPSGKRLPMDRRADRF